MSKEVIRVENGEVEVGSLEFSEFAAREVLRYAQRQKEKNQSDSRKKREGGNRDLQASPTIKEWDDCVGTNFIIGR